MDFSHDLVRGTIVPLVLALLKDHPRYGYEIAKLVNARSGGKLELKEGTLYPALHRLESDGLVKSEWQDAPAAEAPGRKRKYYALTRNGRGELQRRAAEWTDFSDAVNKVLNASLT